MLTLSCFTLSKNNGQVLSTAKCFRESNGESNIITLGMHKINLGTAEAAKFNNIEYIPITESVVYPNYNAAT
jgi:hypothetical protein